MPTYIDPPATSATVPRIFKRSYRGVVGKGYDQKRLDSKFTMYELARHQLKALIDQIDLGNKQLGVTIDSLYPLLTKALEVAQTKETEWETKGGHRLKFS